MAMKSLLLVVQAGLAEDAWAAFLCGSITAQITSPGRKSCPGAVGIQGCCVHGELLLSGSTRLAHPVSPLLLGSLLVPKDRH